MKWNKKRAGQEVKTWLRQLKSKGGFGVHADILKVAKRDFESERVNEADSGDNQGFLLKSCH